jgi:hypothetical protein
MDEDVVSSAPQRTCCNTHLQFDLIVKAKEQRDGVPTNTAPIYSPVDGRFEDVVCSEM